MECQKAVTKRTLLHWHSLLCRHSPKSLKMLAILGQEVHFGPSPSVTWFFNSETESLCALKHLNSEEKNRQIYINFFSKQDDHIDDILECLETHLDFDRGITFQAVEEEFWPKVMKFIRQHHGCVSVFPCFKFYDDSTINNANSEVLSCLDNQLSLRPLPHETTVTTVDSELDASLVYSNWKFATKFSAQDILQQVPKKLIVGIYKGDQLVSWIIIDEFGTLAKLYTVEAHRGRSLALHVLCFALKRCFEMGIPGLAFVEQENLPSFNLFSKANFNLAKDKVAFILSVPHSDHNSCIAEVVNHVRPGHS